MAYQTSQASKQEGIRDKVTTKSRLVKQVLTLAKAHLGKTQAPQASQHHRAHY